MSSFKVCKCLDILSYTWPALLFSCGIWHDCCLVREPYDVRLWRVTYVDMEAVLQSGRQVPHSALAATREILASQATESQRKVSSFVALFLVVFCRLVSWPCHRAILRSAGVFRGFYVSVCVAIPHFLIFLCFIRLSIICVMGVTNPGNEWLYDRSSANSVLSHVLFAAFTGKHFADDFYTIRPDDTFYLYSFL